MKKNTEAFARYHQAKESLAEYTQIGTAAIQLLRLNVSVSNGASLLGQFVDSCGSSHWSEGKRFPDPVRKTTQIGEMLCHQVLVQQVAAFDLFSRSVLSDFSRFSSWARENCPELKHDHALLAFSPQGRWVASPCCYEQENKLGDLIERLTDIERITLWKPSERLKPILPLFDLARMCRNRIVHSDGVVGSDLAEFSQGNDVKNALLDFRKQYTKSDIPILPQWKRGDPLHITPENAIFFGAVIYEIAKEINIYICSNISDDEFVEMAFFYSCIVETHSFRTIRHRDAEARIKHFLASRYLYREASRIKDVCTPLKVKIYGGKGRSTIETTMWKVALEKHDALREFEAQTISNPLGGKPNKSLQRTARKLAAAEA